MPVAKNTASIKPISKCPLLRTSVLSNGSNNSPNFGSDSLRKKIQMYLNFQLTYHFFGIGYKKSKKNFGELIWNSTMLNQKLFF